MSDDKKAFEEQQVENRIPVDAAAPSSIEDRARLEKRLVRKLDARFSILIVIYILNYIDRNNMSAAKTRGIEADLKLTGNQYPTLLSILYVGYISLQIPSNMLVQYTGRPSYYLPACIVIWGAISLSTGFVHNFTGALLTRLFLGMVECSFFPGAIFLLSKWYTKHELGLRTAILYCGSLISNALGPLIAAGILDGMDGKLGLTAWRWLFIVEGALTIAVGVIAIPILPDFPHNTRGFSVEEKKLAILRMVEDAGEVDDEENQIPPMKALALALGDYKAWVMAISLTCLVISLSFNQFFPQLTTTLGYSKTISLLLCAPPFFFATIMAFLTARHSDKTQERYLHIVVPILFGMVGFIMALATEQTAVRYVSMFLMAQMYSGFVVLFAWISSTFPRPAAKRAIAVAFINAFSQLGNISGSYTYQAAWAPRYTQSFGIGIACSALCIVGVTFHRFTLVRLNSRIDEIENSEDGEAKTLETNVPKGFRYVA